MILIFLEGRQLGKFPKAKNVFKNHFGDAKFEKGRGYDPAFLPYIKIEEPDLMVYK